MIPILYAAGETTFTSYGLGALSDTITCVVTEERNGPYEMIMTYPITGKLYSAIQAERLIKCKARDVGDDQVFRIYRISKPIRGVVTIYAQHISYDLSGICLSPYTYTGTCAGVMASIFSGTPFTGYSNKTGTKSVKITTPKSIRATLGGTQGSLLDLWGGEFKWDNYKVYLNTARGSDKGVLIEYGKNLTDLVSDHDLSDVYSELQPYATYTDSSNVEHTVMGTAISITSVITRTKTLIKDMTDQLGLAPGAVPTVNQINTAAASWLANNPLGYETPSLTVSFINTPTPADYPTVSIELCDTITVRYTALGVDVKAKIVKSEYDSLAERYIRLTIGTPKANMANTVATLTDQVSEMEDYPNRWNDAIRLATQLITGNLGGYVVIHEGPDGTPYEILIMDNENISLAENVWRWNLGGLGFSSTGYAGPYATAITADGMINADFIKTGTLIADMLTVYDANNNILFKADKTNKSVSIGGLSVGKDYIGQHQTPGANANWFAMMASGGFQVNTNAATADDGHPGYSAMKGGNITMTKTISGDDYVALVDADRAQYTDPNGKMATLGGGYVSLEDTSQNLCEVSPTLITINDNDTKYTNISNASVVSGGTVGTSTMSPSGYTSANGTLTGALDSGGLTFGGSSLRDTSLRLYSLNHNSGTTEATYTIDLPPGLYTILHGDHINPLSNAQGLQILSISSTSGTASVVTTLTGSGSHVTATSGTRSQVTVGNSNGSKATLTWTVQGRTYRRLEITRHN